MLLTDEMMILREQHKIEIKSWKDKCDLANERIRLLQDSLAQRDKTIVELQIEMRNIVSGLADKAGMASRTKMKDRNQSIALSGK